MFSKNSSRFIFITVIGGVTLVAVGLAIGVVIGLHVDSHSDDDKGTTNRNTGSAKTYKSSHGTYRYAAVASDNAICSEIGKDIMVRHRGNAVDAGVATMLCLGAMSSHSAGLGGGSFTVLYHKDKGWHAIDSRERAPLAATKNMFVKPEDKEKSKLGGLSIGVPGEVIGAVEMHARYGAISWKTLVTPTIRLLRNGFPLPEATFKALNVIIGNLQDKTGFKMFLDANDQVKPVGSIIQMPKLAQTFQIVADDPMSFYNGSLAQNVVNDIKDAGGIIQLDDLKNYKPSIKTPTQLKLPGNMTLYSMPAPGSGPILAYILSILSGYNMSSDSIATDKRKVQTYHRIVEAMKFAYVEKAYLGDEDFVDIESRVGNLTSRSYAEATRLRINESYTQDVSYYKPSYFNVDDAGTSHLSVVDGEGNAISITSTINYYFGSKVVGSRTGIFFNNEMDDFSTPNMTNPFGFGPSESNFIEPGKRPQSSMSPTIVWDDTKSRVSLVTGAAGGAKIITATALAIMDTLWFNVSVPQSLDLPRIHHQLMPMAVQAESDLDPVIKAGLKEKGHQLMEPSGFSVVQMLHVLHDSIVAACDFRKGGEPSGY